MASRKSLPEEGETSKSLIQKESPEPSFVSMKSNQSACEPSNFSSGDTSADVSLIQKESPEPSFVSMKSNQSACEPSNFSSGDTSADASGVQEESLSRKQLDSIFKDLGHEILSELNMFKRLLNADYSEYSEKEEDEDQHLFREGLLKVTLLVLRKKKYTDIATTLQTKLASFCMIKHKSRLKEQYQRINEGISNQGCSITFHKIYTELYISEGGSGEVNKEHEVRQIERQCWRPETQEAPINCNDLFKVLPGQNTPRSVLTKGVAGIGKTVSVQKFILDWAEGITNQDIHYIFPLPFRELNLMKEKKMGLIELLQYFVLGTKELSTTEFNDYKVLFIFDGLDECRLPLDFQNNDIICDVTESASVDVLLTNLIKGTLLPSALLWITSRPAAASQIPPECVDKVTEVRGFNDLQKNEYFRKRISDQSLASRIITHIKSSRSLYIMCHIPVFCWISATVLERMLSEAESAEIPKTLTQMFTHFLIFQTKLKTQKYNGKYEVDLQQAKKSSLSLGKLAFEQLKKGNLIFYEEDLKQCGIDVKEASVYSGVCTEIFREEIGLHLVKVYSFVHLSVQEFLAALFRFMSFIQDKETKGSITDSLKCEVNKALLSENGHWDLYLRFLLGLSLESNQTLLRDIFTQTGSRSDSKQDLVEHIKRKIRDNPSPEKSINLFHCLNELNDHSLIQEVQSYLSRTGASDLSGSKLSPAQWSALVFVLLNSEKELDEFILRNYKPSEDGLQKLLPVIKASRKSDLSDCNLREKSCSALASVLSTSPCNLRELDLSKNILTDSGVIQLSDGLKNAHCKLQTLKLYHCHIGEKGCAALASALKSNPSHLRELNLKCNTLGDPAAKLLCDLLKDSCFKLEKLQLECCDIGVEGCAALVEALGSNPSHIRELNLNRNKLKDSGVSLLYGLLKDQQCKLVKLQLCDCIISENGCDVLVSALKSNPSHLSELDLSRNKVGDSGVNSLSDLLQDPCCKLKKLQLSNCCIGEEGFSVLVSALRSNPSHLRELDLNYNTPGESGVKQLSELIKNPDCKLEKLLLCHCSIPEEGCVTLVSALRSNPSHLRDLILSDNKPEDTGCTSALRSAEASAV
ncbi:NACHT, LRR and PYD domains-containing protein 12 [Carassius gibelio]|uniref:NACHT, LRR and PYD domains-containing protein 12 n=1 Tax=Carassius gibelio TaxID=101364 RepID=UPI002278BC46|nr:NACHT, LRR and PYD domains-containing protein 12 [Carassius gibelio]